MKRSTYWLGLLAALSMPSAQAANQEIRALFQPNPSQPNKNVFINQTPNSGFCTLYPAQCGERNMYSIQLPIRFNSRRAIVPGDGFPLKVPANWRQLTVTNTHTQQTEQVDVRITGIGSDYVLSDSAAKLTGETDDLEGHRKLWTTSSWGAPPSPCQYSGLETYTADSFRFFWKVSGEWPCTKVAAFSIPSMYFNTLDFAYELRTPNPLGMSSGLYTGALSYSLGPGGDFDFGPLMQPDDGNLTLDFALDVQHTLKVDLPAGGDNVALQPEGGWRQWTHGGQKPARIFADQVFYISASSRFKVQVLCESTGEGCRMFGGGRVADVAVYLTLPAGITFGGGGGNVEKYRLAPGGWAPFEPTQYVDRKVGVLHFDMPQRAINNLLVPGFSSAFATDITVIWDSEV